MKDYTDPTPYDAAVNLLIGKRNAGLITMEQGRLLREEMAAAEGYRLGRNDEAVEKQASIDRLISALEAVTAQLGTFMESNAWTPDDETAYRQGDDALQRAKGV